MIDLRSDTATRPTEGMRAAIASAAVGDEQKREDPSVNALQERAAALLGQEAALFVPTATMANQVALGSWTRPGDEIVVQRWAHVTTFEGGAAGFLHGLQSITLGDLSGGMDPSEVRAAVRPAFVHCPRTALVCLEQTHNVAGGRVIPLEEIAAVSAVARERPDRVRFIHLNHSNPALSDRALREAIRARGFGVAETGERVGL